jgi:kynurenine formamidase
MSDPLLELVQRGVRMFDLGRPMFQGMPQSPNHPQYWHSLPRRHGDKVRDDGGSAANDLLVTGTHVGTHIDALAHVSHNGRLFGGADAQASAVGGRFMELGVHTIEPMVRRGILLDVPGALGLVACAGGYEITPEDLEAAVTRQGVEVAAGDVVLVRSGWGRQFNEGVDAYQGQTTGVPGVGEAGARWLVAKGAFTAGADTIAFERLAPGGGHSLLPAHRVLLVESGVYIIEALALDEFTFVLIPLNLIGATGSPVRPLAVVSHV